MSKYVIEVKWTGRKYYADTEEEAFEIVRELIDKRNECKEYYKNNQKRLDYGIRLFEEKGEEKDRVASGWNEQKGRVAPEWNEEKKLL